MPAHGAISPMRLLPQGLYAPLSQLRHYLPPEAVIRAVREVRGLALIGGGPAGTARYRPLAATQPATAHKLSLTQRQ